jgi:GNAT superfamily N-acetyltransferase
VHVRRARPEDAAAIAEVHVRSWQRGYEHIFGAEKLAAIDVERRRELALRMISTASTGVAEDDDGRIVAFVGVRPSTDVDGEGEIWALYAVEEAWGTGAATALMDWAKDVLRASWPAATLWVLEDNPRARRFYEREGWSPDGEAKSDAFLGVRVNEVRYRIRLRD